MNALLNFVEMATMSQVTGAFCAVTGVVLFAYLVVFGDYGVLDARKRRLEADAKRKTWKL